MAIKDDIDNEILTLGSEVYAAYKKAKGDASVYSKELKELSDKYGKSLGYLRQIRNEYMKYVKDDIDKFGCNLKSSCGYDAFFDDLFKVPFDGRTEYLISNGVTYHELNKKCNGHKKNNGVYSFMLDDLLEDCYKFLGEISKNSRKNKLIVDYTSACIFFDNLVNSGYYSFCDYAERLCSSKYEYGELIDKIFIIKNKIKAYSEDKWKYYVARMEKNRKRQFLLNRDSIEEFNNRLCESFNCDGSFNIIDYYLIVGLPLKKYEEITRGFISPSYITNFNRFVGSLDILESDIFYNEEYVRKCNYRVADRVISDSEKEQLIGFFKAHNIPLRYFMFGITKYLRGDLDNYLDSFEKKL